MGMFHEAFKSTYSARERAEDEKRERALKSAMEKRQKEAFESLRAILGQEWLPEMLASLTPHNVAAAVPLLLQLGYHSLKVIDQGVVLDPIRPVSLADWMEEEIEDWADRPWANIADALEVKDPQCYDESPWTAYTYDSYGEEWRFVVV